MKRGVLTIWALAAFFFLTLAGAAAAELPANHEKFWNENANYQVMYQLYDVATMNEYNLFDEAAYDAMEKENEAAIAEDVKKGLAAGKSEVDAYVEAYAARVLDINRIVTWKLTEDVPLAGYYELASDTLAGYMGLYCEKEKKGCALEFVVWDKAKPADFGRSSAVAAAMKEKFSTTAVQSPKDMEMLNDPKIQIEISIDNGTATVRTTEAFRKGGYVDGTVPGEDLGDDYVRSGLLIDGKYVLKK